MRQPPRGVPKADFARIDYLENGVRVQILAAWQERAEHVNVIAKIEVGGTGEASAAISPLFGNSSTTQITAAACPPRAGAAS